MHAETDLDEDWQQHGRFDPPVEMQDYFEFAASVARQEAARLRAERETEQDEPCPFGEVSE